ncbi:polysaccharide deacetylase family protein [Desulfoplanes formicivorans]|uniref:polysaccharide deacetylase family protein n=1 Tax=Desulfoplanes formicivorans TaxID=1592317 RepID=UPI00159F292F|nr:polysaccharide deacetylase family protein [Desulfoplanes formicivorans]
MERFRAHLDTICRMGFRTISAQELLQICLGKGEIQGKPIVITFDDCHVSNWIHAIPELKKRGMGGIFFAITDFIIPGPLRTRETAPSFKPASESFVQALRYQDYSQFMTRNELIAVLADHNMEVYSHTSRHQGCFRNLTRVATVGTGHWSAHGIYDQPSDNLPTYQLGSAYAYNGYWPGSSDNDPNSLHKRSDEERMAFCVRDFQKSFATMKELNQADKQFICWPWGEFDEMTIKAAKQAGFSGAFNLDRFVNGPGTDPFQLHRIPVSHRKSVKWLRSRLLMHASRPGAMVFRKFFRKKS